jgi:hypothetical protein
MDPQKIFRTSSEGFLGDLAAKANAGSKPPEGLFYCFDETPWPGLVGSPAL